MSHFTVEGQRLTWRGDGQTVVVEPWGAHSARVRAARVGDVADADHALLAPEPCEATVQVDGDVAEVRNGGLTVRLQSSSWHNGAMGHVVWACSVSFHDASGQLLFKEAGAGGSLRLRARYFAARSGGSYRLTASFEAPEDERLWGMGLYQQAAGDIKGCTFELAHRNSQASVPFVLSSAGYGFLWNCPAIGRATFARNRTEWVAQSAGQLDYWVTAGTPSEVISAYTAATGRAPQMPEYGLGLWQCKLRYTNQAQLVEVAREYQRRGVPLDVIVADFFHWPHLGDFRFEEEFWPDPAGMVAELRELGAELMVSVWPLVAFNSENYADASQQGVLVAAERGPAEQFSLVEPAVYIDFTNPRARCWVWEACREGYYKAGVRMFWLDEAEPELVTYDFDNYRYHAGPGAAVANRYPLDYVRAFWEGLQAAGQQDVVNLVRCAWSGSARYGALLWSGDVHSSWDDFRRQVAAGIHLGVVGIPWFTTDIGGFHGGNASDPAFVELLVRWFQFGAFCPVLRMHGDRQPSEDVRSVDGSARLGTGAPNELWSYGEDVFDLLAAQVRRRERMRPYLRQLMAEAHTDGRPLIRGLFYQYPDDPICWDLPDQYLFGPDVLVAPVLEPGVTSRRVYLPQGQWIHVATGEVFTTPGWIEVGVELGDLPIFATTRDLANLLRID